MANNWEHFPGGVAAIDVTRHEIQRPQTEPQHRHNSSIHAFKVVFPHV
jgi:hypothetical protein